MSWNPLKKLSKGQSLSASQTLTNDNMETNISALNQAEATTKKLYKINKRFSDSILAMNRFESIMTTDLSNSVLCQEEEQLRSVIEEWHTFTIESIKNGEEFATTIQSTVIEPLKRWQSAFNEVRACLKRYDQLKNDLNKYNYKKQKYTEKEKTSQNILKLNNICESLTTTQKEYNLETQVLNREIPVFIESRIDYFQPSLAALIRSEAHYWETNVSSFKEHDSMITDRNNDSKRNDYYKRQSQRLEQINSLSIVDNQ
ncbi:bridging integrator 3-like [Oppia nitens]|uniref:bridging integrator 3-like n=1 Tax=Oppia nitens TaxID=1686743 RepID=UPI0023DA362F|nr:bridging integrator 3-like [Oppia nitens]